MSSFYEWRKLTSRTLYFSFSVYLYSLVPVAWAPSVNRGSWPAEISTLASMFINILWCLKLELLLWVEEADQQKSLLWLLCLSIFFGTWRMSSLCEWRKLTTQISTLVSVRCLFIFFGACRMSSFCEWGKLTTQISTLNSVSVQILPRTNKKIKKNLDLYCFVTSLWLFIFEEWC